MIEFSVNGKQVHIGTDPEVPLLWVLREQLALKGTKACCLSGACGVCTVHVDNTAIRSCITPVSAVAGKKITTIEGLAENPQQPLIRAWVDEQVSQCGYCQPGQVLSALALLIRNPSPSDTDINRAMANVLCRCGTYLRIRKAIKRAAQYMAEESL